MWGGAAGAWLACPALDQGEGPIWGEARWGKGLQDVGQLAPAPTGLRGTIRGAAGQGNGLKANQIVGIHGGGGELGEGPGSWLSEPTPDQAGSLATVHVIMTGCSSRYSVLVAGFFYIY